MADFDLTNYFNKRFGNTGTDKIKAVVDASQEKVIALGKYRDQMVINKAVNDANEAAAQSHNSSSVLGVLQDISGASNDGVLAPDGLLGAPINNAVAMGSGLSMLSGYVASGIHDLNAMDLNKDIPQEVKDARARMLAGTATDADMQLLALPRGDVVKRPETTDYMHKVRKDFKTNLEQITDMETSLDRAVNARKFFDLSGAVHTGTKDALTKDLGESANDSIAKFSKGIDQVKDGKTGSGLADMAVGLGGALSEIPGAALRNKQGAVTFLAENAANLAASGLGKIPQALSNVGYGLDAFGQGVDAQRTANHGAIPTNEDLAWKAGLAATAVAAEYAGDKLSGVTDLFKPAKKAVADEAKTALKKALGMVDNPVTRTAGAAVKGGSGEFLTEGYQTWAENAMKMEDTSLKQAYEGGAIGAIIGGGTGIAANLGAELTGNTPGKVLDRQATLQEKKTFSAAVAANDPSAYLDSEARTYNPTKGAEVLLAHARLDTTTPEVRQENLAKATDLVSGLEEKLNQNMVAYDRASEPTFDKAATQTQLVAFKERLDSLDQADPANAKMVKGLTEAIQLHEMTLTASESKTNLKLQKAKADALAKQVVQVTNVKDALAEVVRGKTSVAEVQKTVIAANAMVDANDAPAMEAAQKAVNKVISLSMVNLSSLSVEAANDLADNKANSLTAPQRQYLREFSKSRQAENQAKSVPLVSQDVFLGSPGSATKTRQLGIKDYNKNIGQALEAKDRITADRQLELLSNFVEDHSNKLEQVSAAYRTVKTRGDAQIARIKEAGKPDKWVRVAKPDWSKAGKAALRDSGGLEVHSNSDQLLNAIEFETHALQQTLKTQQAAYNLTFQGNSTVQSTTTPTVATTATQAAGAAQAAEVVGGATQTNPNPSVVKPVAQTAAAPTSVATVDSAENVREYTDAITNVSTELTKNATTATSTVIDTDLISENTDVAILLEMLGVTTNNGRYTVTPSAKDILTAQARIVDVYTSVLAGTTKIADHTAELGKLLSWFKTDATTQDNPERKARAEKGAAKYGNGNPEAHLLIQLAEEMGELLSEVNRLTGQKDLSEATLEVQKRAFKVLRFGATTSNKDQKSIYFGKTNAEAYQQAVESAASPLSKNVSVLENAEDKARPKESKEQVAKAVAKINEVLQRYADDVRIMATETLEHLGLPRASAAVVYEGAGYIALTERALTTSWKGFSQEESIQIRIAHEAAHIQDWHQGNSGNSRALLEGGWLPYFKSIYNDMDASDLMHPWLEMVFSPRRYGHMDEVTQSSELYAQLAALHSFNPELLQSRFPEAFQFIEDSYANDRRAIELTKRGEGNAGTNESLSGQDSTAPTKRNTTGATTAKQGTGAAQEVDAELEGLVSALEAQFQEAASGEQQALITAFTNEQEQSNESAQASQTQDSTTNQDPESSGSVQAAATGETNEATGGLEGQDSQASEGGKLSLLSQYQEKLTGTVNEIFRTVNLVAQYFKQTGVNETNLANKPLVGVKGFLSAWDKNFDLVKQYLDLGKDNTLFEEQDAALNNLGATMQSWMPAIQANFKKFTGSVDFKSNDMMQYLYTEDGALDVDENVKTAIAYAAYRWIMDKANSPIFMEPEQVKDMHNVDEDANIDPIGLATLRRMSSFKDTAIAELGKVAAQALGLALRDDAPVDLLPKLESALGTHVLGLLETAGYLKQESLPAAQVNAYFDLETDAKFSEYTTYNYVQLITKKEGNKTIHTDDVRKIKAANQGSGDVVNKLFGVTVAPRMPDTKPSKLVQKTAKDSQQDIPKAERKAVQDTMNVPHTIIQDMWAVAQMLGRDAILKIAGAKDLESGKYHEINRSSIEAQNQNVGNQYDMMDELLHQSSNENGFEQAFYVMQSIWKNFRAGFSNQAMNLQTSKIHRFMFARPDWTVKIDFDNQALVDEFLVSVAMALGIKTDQQRNTSNLVKFEKHLLEKPEVMQAVKVLQEAITKGDTALLATKDKELVQDVAASAEGMMTLQAMVAFAKYLNAKEAKQNDVTVTMLVGADGKTNGPMLTLLALGADGFKTLNRGGFYSIKDSIKHFSEYFEGSKAMDLYQDLGMEVLAAAKGLLTPRDAIQKLHSAKKHKEAYALSTIEEFSAFQVLTKALDKDGKVTSAMRNLVKTPLTSFFFGSAMKSSVKGMEDKFIENFYTTIEDLAQGSRTDITLVDFLKATNTLIAKGSSKAPKYSESLSIEEMLTMKHALTPVQEMALRQSFNVIMGNSVKVTMNTYFNTFIERRNKINKAIQSSWETYAAVYADAYNAELDSLMEAGKIAYREVIKGKDEGKKIPLHGLTVAQEKVLRLKISNILPVMHTAYSKEEDNIRAGIYMGKTEVDKSKSPILSNTIITTKGKVTTQSHVRKEISPGVAGLPFSIHSLDSSIMHKALNTVPETMNVHDEGANGVDKIAGVATALNKATIENLLEYSPAHEAVVMLERLVIGLAQRVKDGLTSKEAVKAVFGSWESTHNRNLEEPVSIEDIGFAMIDQAVQNAYAADRVRLTNISEMGHVDQYTWEGGQFEVTQGIRDRATALLGNLDKKASIELVDAMRYLNKVRSEAEIIAMEESDELELERASVVNEPEPTTPKMSDWGVIGEPAIESDPALVAMFAGNKVLPAKAFIREFAKLLDGSVNRVDVAAANAVEVKVYTAADAFETKLEILFSAEKAEFNQLDGLTTKLTAKQQRRYLELENTQAAISAAAGITQDSGGVSEDALSEIKKLIGTAYYQEMLELRKTARALRKEANKPISKTRSFDTAMGMLLKHIYNIIPDTMMVTYVTSETHFDPEIHANPSNSRGWYVPQGKGQGIYLLGNEFAASNLQVETVIHELLHAVLLHATENAVKGSNAAKLVTELETLLSKVTAEIKDTKFKDAITDVHELISWGLSNREFQTDVLMKIKMESKTKGNPLITGMAKLFNSITDFLFDGLGMNRKAMASNGLSILTANVSGLFQEAANNQGPVQVAAKSQVNLLNNHTTESLYDDLDTGEVSPEFGKFHKAVLDKIVDKIFGPAGSFRDAVMKNTPQGGLQVFTEALVSGIAPFASKLLGSNIRINQQEAYVVEQVEATVAYGLGMKEGRTALVRNELQKLYRDMEQRLKPADRKDGSPESELYNTVFNAKESDYLAKFAAMGLGHEQFNGLLKVATKKNTKILADNSPIGILTRLFSVILNAINGRLTQTFGGQQADAKLTHLVQTLVVLEQKREIIKNSTDPDWKVFLDKKVGDTRKGAKSTLNTLINSSMFKKNKNVFIRAGSNLFDVVTAPGRIKVFNANLGKIRDNYFTGIPGVVSGVFNDMKGHKPTLEFLLRSVKHHEALRQQAIELTNGAVLESFNDPDAISNEAKGALTKVVLRTGSHVLLDSFTMAQLETLVKDPAALQTEIDALEAQLKAGYTKSHYEAFIGNARALAYQLVTGRSTARFLLRNAHNIASMHGSAYVGQLTEAQTSAATKTIDALVSLNALKYTPNSDKELFADLLEKENARTDGGNGVQMAMLQHKDLEEQALDRIFEGNPVLMLKGYMPEVYNPHTDLKAATEEEGKTLLAMGYVEHGFVPQDPDDMGAVPVKLYTLHDGGLLPWLSGIMSFTGMRSKGTKHHGDRAVGIQKAMTAAKQQAINKMHRMGSQFDPTVVKENFTVPLLNGQGTAVNYVHLMENATKDNLLERDSKFDTVLGNLAGSIFDKENSPKNNRKAVQLLHDEFESGYAKDSVAFLEVGPESTNAELREIYQMLPKSTKEAIRDIWGTDSMKVRADTLDIMFGYRELSLSYMFDKKAEERGHVEQAVVWVITTILRQHAKRKLGMTNVQAEVYSQRGAVVIRRAENVWHALVKETKDIFVVKSGVTLLGNILSNKTTLMLYGVPFKDILANSKVAWEGAEDYDRDNKELFRLQTQLNTGYIMGDKSEIEQRIAQLEHAMATNPVAELIEAGLMPTIAEDMEAHDDDFAYKPGFVKKMEAMASKLNPTVREVGNQIYMGHSTRGYKSLARITRLSDFTARYALYQHLTTQKVNPMTAAEAIQEASDAFINYDIPMHRKLHYLDKHGFLMFTKYFLRIQRVIRGRFREAPGKMLLLMTAQSYLHYLPSIMDSSILTRFGNNPFNTGALQFITAGDDLLTTKAALSVFK